MIAELRAALLAHMNNDSILRLLVTGGIYDAEEVGEISRQNTPGAFDSNGELLPSVLLRLAQDSNDARFPEARLATWELLLQGRDAGDLTTIRSRLRSLFYEWRPAIRGAWNVSIAEDLSDLWTAVLDARLTIIRLRGPYRILKTNLLLSPASILPGMRIGAHLGGVYAITYDVT